MNLTQILKTKSFNIESVSSPARVVVILKDQVGGYVLCVCVCVCVCVCGGSVSVLMCVNFFRSYGPNNMQNVLILRKKRPGLIFKIPF